MVVANVDDLVNWLCTLDAVVEIECFRYIFCDLACGIYPYSRCNWTTRTQPKSSPCGAQGHYRLFRTVFDGDSVHNDMGRRSCCPG